ARSISSASSAGASSAGASSGTVKSVIHIVERLHDPATLAVRVRRTGQSGGMPDRPGPELRTERLTLRRWQERDRAPFAALNADPVVMEFFPSTLSPAESDAFVDRIEAAFDERGWGLWAVEIPD